jgi:membrane-associated phospholipid phosphatase
LKNISNIINQNRIFFLVLVFFLGTCVSLLLFTGKAEGFLFISPYHSRVLDLFFIGYTYLGDGIFTLLVVVFYLLTSRFRFAWQILAAFIISGLIAQIFKYSITSPRPSEFFHFRQSIHIIEGVTRNGFSSFPSGHTATAFALATLLSLFNSNKKIGILFLLAAILVAYSRIYLSQHFPADITAGAVIGVSVAIFVYSFFSGRMQRSKSADRDISEEFLVN